MNNNQINVNLDNCTAVRCGCGNETFHLIHFVKRVPGIMVGQTSDQFIPVPVYECVRCKNLLDFGKLARDTPENPQKKGSGLKNFLSNF